MIIIPARLQSTRLPKKILADINGIPMVIRTALQAQTVDDVVIAADSEEVIEVVKSYNIKAVLTDINHKSGSDRIKEASDVLGLKDDDIVINLQGDEPFIEPEILQEVKNRLLEIKNRDFVMVSCYKYISELDAEDSNLVKVVVDKNSDAMYFSRSKIPYNRDASVHKYKGHIGIYGFDKKSLDRFCTMKAHIEDVEKLEQLRVVFEGEKISMVEVETKSFGVDTIDDLHKARDWAK